ncbi:SDR family NAD(P)-dependent oxidoreductase [Lysinibacillus sp. NPDC096418]|uniref:SDR family NAD(P)-dependent oxidoreductase n=1 Tax=Lysinibacillus sp. NPDC096418 TaxID=3364138 RepID=UPI0037F20D77
MKKALVVGASGGMGFALVCELASRDIQVIAFSRGKEKLVSLFQHKQNVTILAGDALNKQEMLKAAHGVDVIFHAVSFPYQEWDHKHLECINIMIEVAQAQQAKIALVDNIYAYGRQNTRIVTEEAHKNPHTKKGRIRLSMENTLKDSGVPSLIVHMPDLYGPNAESTILFATLKSIVQQKKANFVGDMHVAREFLYTFDGAKAMVELALRSDTYNQNWNIPAVHPITGEELIKIVNEITDYQKGIRTVSKGMIRFLGIFSPFMKEMVEMMYLTEEPVILSGAKYEQAIGVLPRTSYREGVYQAIEWIRKDNYK